MPENRAKTETSDTPYAKKIEAEQGTPDQLEDRIKKGVSREEALIDESLEETFPASDPIAPKQIT